MSVHASSVGQTGSRSMRPRVGVIRGVTPGRATVVADVRRQLPTEVLDPVAIEGIKSDARREGHEAGYAAGLAAAQAEADRIIAQATAQQQATLDALLDAVNQLRSREATALAQVADQTALLSLRIAEIVLAREVETAADPGREAIARAIGLVPEEGEVRIRMNPTDLERLGDTSSLLAGRSVTMVPDATITSGGCEVVVGATRVDAQIPTALGRVAEVLR